MPSIVQRPGHMQFTAHTPFVAYVHEFQDTCSEHRILEILRFSMEELARYNSMAPYRYIDENNQYIDIPAAYAREKGETIFERCWNDPRTATHTLLIKPAGVTRSDHLTVYSIPVHDFVLLTQCGNWQDVVLNDRMLNISTVLPLLKIAVPEPRAMHPLLRFLHFHDQAELYSALMDYDEDQLMHFARNVRALGVIDYRIQEVVRSVLGV